jgi:DNA-binding transcriptional LysR family regulator
MHNIDLRNVDLNLLPVLEVLLDELSVSRTGDRLGRTQSAVSHALSRLRQQLQDPLLVKTGGVMRPTPRALQFMAEVKPLLRQMAQALQPASPFDAARSTRSFRLAAPDFLTPLFTRLLAQMTKTAPGITIEWLSPRENAFLELAEGQFDVLLAPVHARLPDGIASDLVGHMHWRCFMRAEHPALARWSARAWQQWPHIQVRTGSQRKSPVQQGAETAGLKRRVGVEVPNFAAVAPLLAESNLMATLPDIALRDAAARYGLVRRPVPFPLEPFPHAMHWSLRQQSDPANQWLRRTVRPIALHLFAEDKPRRQRG